MAGLVRQMRPRGTDPMSFFQAYWSAFACKTSVDHLSHDQEVMFRSRRAMVFSNSPGILMRVPQLFYCIGCMPKRCTVA